MDWINAYNKGFNINSKNPSKIVSIVEPYLDNSCKFVLDVGCGEGRNSYYLAKKYIVDALDVVDFGIKHRNIFFYKTNITNFNLNKNYNLIIFARVIQYINFNNLELIFKKIYNNLAESGFICISYSYKSGIKNKNYGVDIFEHNPDKLKKLFNKLNLNLIYFKEGSNVSKHVPYNYNVLTYDIILQK